MSSATDSRTKRLLDLVVLLLDVKHPVPFSELRDQFSEYRTTKPEAGQRAFERDKATLLELGVPIRWIGPEEDNDAPPEGGYIIDRQKYRLPEVSLSADEVAALVVTASAARHQPEFPYRHAADLAVRKLMFDLAGVRGNGRRNNQSGQALGPGSAVAVAELAQQGQPGTEVLVHMPSTYRSRSLGEHLSHLEEAVRQRKRVTIQYDHPRSSDSPPREWPAASENPAATASAPAPSALPSHGHDPDGAVPQPMPPLTSDRWNAAPVSGTSPVSRDVDPYGLVYRQGAWLLVGYCHVARAVRRFRVDRIVDLKVAPRPRSPDFEVPADFSLQEHGSFSPWRFKRAEPVAARLWVSADTPWVAEEDFGAATREVGVRDGDSEGILVDFPCTNPDYLISRVLGAAGALRVLSPPALRRKIADAAAAVARRNTRFDLHGKG